MTYETILYREDGPIGTLTTTPSAPASTTSRVCGRRTRCTAACAITPPRARTAGRSGMRRSGSRGAIWRPGSTRSRRTCTARASSAGSASPYGCRIASRPPWCSSPARATDTYATPHCTRTTPWARSSSCDFAGRIADRLVRRYYNAALRRLDEGLATADDLDTTLRLGLGYPEGPIALLERTGLAHHFDVTHALFEAYGEPPYAPARRARVAKQRSDAR